MPQASKITTMTAPYCGPCPTCGCRKMTRRAKDANSTFMDWIECSDDNCNYEASFDAFRAAYAVARRANG